MDADELHRLGVTFRPFSTPVPTAGAHRPSPFRASWRRTMYLLGRELRELGAQRVVCELAIQDADIRVDGLPRASARAAHPGVALAFASRYGPLRYYTDEFAAWHENLRAIALAMEALRKVDRYGVSKRGEQYQGWRALPRPRDGDVTTVDDATRVLSAWDGDWKAAARETHPDTDGGDAERFRRVMQARDVLREAGIA